MKIKNPKAQKICAVKKILKFEDYKHCLEATHLNQFAKIILMWIIFKKIIPNL